jgi:hypothetical protein
MRAGPGASVAERRAKLVVQCACEILGIEAAAAPAILQLPLSVIEFENELRNRFGAAQPDLVFRTDSTLERARLDRRVLPEVPKVILRQGAPRRDERANEQPAGLDAHRLARAAQAPAGPGTSARSTPAGDRRRA